MSLFLKIAAALLCVPALFAEEVNFKAPKDIAAGSVSGVSSMDAGFINNDNRADVVVIEGGKHASGRKTFAWFEAPLDPQETWIRHDISHGATLRSFLGSAKLADFDKDGDLDLAVSSDNHSGSSMQADLWILLNPGGNGTGTWVSHKCNASTMALHHINDMEIADIDDDGRLDVVVRSLEPNQIHIFFQNSVSSWTQKTIDTGIEQSEGLSVAKINNDSRTDITFTGYWLQTPSSARTGAYVKYPIDSSYKDTNQNTKESCGDIDKDGLMDVIIGPAESYRNGKNHILAWYKNPGSNYNSNWEKHVIRSNTNCHHTVKLADIDADNDLDVITGKPWSTTGVSKESLIFYNDGSGGFAQVQQLVNGKGLYTGVVIDIGNDGDLDIIGQDSYASSSRPWLYESNLLDAQPPADTIAPTIPSNLSAVANGSASINLSWNASTDNVGVTAYELKRGTSTIATQNTRTFSDTGLKAGTMYSYTVRARDAAGNWSSTSASASASTAIIVNLSPNAHVIATPTSGEYPLLVNFNASGSTDADGSITNYTWNFGDTNNGSGVNPSHTYTSAGIYTAMVTVSDDNGATDTAQVVITVNNPVVAVVRDAFVRIEAESYDAMQGIGIYNGGTGKKIGSIENTTYTRYDDVDFSTGALSFAASAASNTSGGTIELRLDSKTGTLIGSCSVAGTGGWNNFVNISGPINAAYGIHDLYLVFKGGGGALLDVDYFQFNKVTNPVSNITPTAVPLSSVVGGVAPLSITFDGSSSSDSDGTIAAFAWNFADGASATVISPTYTFALSGTYHVSLTVTDDDGAQHSDVITITVTDPIVIPPLGLPSPWLAQDIGVVAKVGNATYDSVNQRFTVSGSGNDIWYNADEFQFVHQSYVGDFILTARVLSQTKPNTWAKAGVMIRDSLDANAKSALMCVTASNGTSFDWRLQTGGQTAKDYPNDGIAAPNWLRIERIGNIVIAYRSSNGISFTQIGQRTISFNATVKIGLAVTAHKDGSMSTAVFDNVSLVPLSAE